METRIQAVKVTKVLHNGHTFKSIWEFPPGVFLTNREVICQVLNEEIFLRYSYEAAHRVAQEFVQWSIWCNVYTNSITGVGSKIQQLIKEFSNLDRYTKTKRGTTFLQKKQRLWKKFCFFDIFRENDARRSHLENVYWLRRCEKDYAENNKSYKMHCCSWKTDNRQHTV